MKRIIDIRSGQETLVQETAEELAAFVAEAAAAQPRRDKFQELLDELAAQPGASQKIKDLARGN